MLNQIKEKLNGSSFKFYRPPEKFKSNYDGKVYSKLLPEELNGKYEIGKLNEILNKKN